MRHENNHLGENFVGDSICRIRSNELCIVQHREQVVTVFMPHDGSESLLMKKAASQKADRQCPVFP